MPTKSSFFLFLSKGTFTSVPKDNKLIKIQKTVEIHVSFFNVLLVGGRIRIRTNNYGSGSEALKNIAGLRIRNTDYRST